MKKLMWLGLILGLLAACSTAESTSHVQTDPDAPTIVVYSSPT